MKIALTPKIHTVWLQQLYGVRNVQPQFPGLYNYLKPEIQSNKI